MNEVKIYEWAEKVRQTNYFEFMALEPEVKRVWLTVQRRIDRGEPPEGIKRESIRDRICRRLGK